MQSLVTLAEAEGEGEENIEVKIQTVVDIIALRVLTNYSDWL